MAPQYCEIYFQELNQVPKVKIREKKIPVASGRRREKGTILNNARALCSS